MAYTRTNYQDSPSTATPLDAANLNNQDAYIATLDTTTAKLASANTFTQPQVIAEALSGTDKAFLTMQATDGKTYSLIITTGGTFQVKNITDNVVVLDVGPTAGAIKAGGNTVWHAGNDGAGSGLDADMIGGRQIRVASADPGLGVGGAWIKDS